MAVNRLEHVPNPGVVQVSPGNGEFLFFTVRAGGPAARFQFASDVKGQLLNQGTFPNHPTTLYEWTFLRDPSDVQQFELLTLGLLFASNSDYRYEVAVHGPAGPRVALDIEYSGGAADFETETFRVLIG
jgi:hypothetical protein